ncbi:alkyl sulfatase dimerization domain-containing protein [Bradyrhizobium sp. LHD-71]|uniref:alkyl/aryl-sulfatase n=1 Tax=Bradyrhizobium sp. LHD-71 TaxID=3072141 RepID=UPI00280CEE6B|nr:alkyl sulfatase dimerization domain-containing protein [Bradyrhizobium sp. LHD-71]MDQ8730749.1 alkyl sulfatase dimerization domain-containing protein [Bradyrhizobium sp. LHD-71]
MTDTSTDPRRLAKDAHPAVAAANAAMLAALPFHDRQDFEDARRGFIDTLPDATILAAAGHAAWTMAPYGFLASDTAPATVNPSLWRQAQLNMNHGLFQVTDRIYQIRGFDLANMTLIEGDTGVIVVDTLTSIEGARAGLELYRKHRGQRPVIAVIYTHTHGDHWGGARGIVSDEDVQSGRVPIIAPDLFMDFAVSENVIAGRAMLRRAEYQFGRFLSRGPRGHVDCGLGKTVAFGTNSLLAPTDFVKETGETRVIDGLEFVFQMAPESEAPAEFHFYVPLLKALNMAENATRNLHNLLPFRGSEVRNAHAWSGYINDALRLWGAEAEVLVGQHHWPVWGSAQVQTHLKQQRDVYKFLHDQTMRLINHGLTAAEIAETIRMPKALDRAWHTRGYYGHVRHNVKAIYQRALGWYDANPAHLDPLPPAALGTRLVAYMGGADQILRKARDDFAAGEFRIVAEVLNHLVFAEPDNEEARLLLADTYEQLGYASESATWRNSYLFGAQELRHGSGKGRSRPPISPATARSLRTSQLLDYLAVRLNGRAAEDKHLVLNCQFADSADHFVLNLENCALTYLRDAHDPNADATLTVDRPVFEELVLQATTIGEATAAGKAKTVGRPSAFQELMDLMDRYDRVFEIIEPRKGMPARS